MDKDQDQIARGAAKRAAMRVVGPRIDAAVEEIETRRELPRDLFDALVAEDFFRLVLPLDYGGAELAPPDLSCLLEDVGRHDASVAWCLGQNNICALIGSYMAPDLAEEIFDGPATTLAWGPGPNQAHAAAGGYRLSGRFDFASGSRHATWLGAHVPVLADGKLRLNAAGKPAVFTLLFRREAVRVLDTWHTIGLKGTGSDSFEADDLFVPEHYVVPRERGQPRRVAGRLYVFSQSNLYATAFSSVALGIAGAMLEAFIAQMRDTVPRGRPARAATTMSCRPPSARRRRGSPRPGHCCTRRWTSSGTSRTRRTGSPWSKTPAYAWPRPGRSSNRARVRWSFIWRPARRRFSRRSPSSDGSAISTRSASRSRAMPRISKPSARS